MRAIGRADNLGKALPNPPTLKNSTSMITTITMILMIMIAIAVVLSPSIKLSLSDQRLLGRFSTRPGEIPFGAAPQAPEMPCSSTPRPKHGVLKSGLLMGVGLRAYKTCNNSSNNNSNNNINIDNISANNTDKDRSIRAGSTEQVRAQAHRKASGGDALPGGGGGGRRQKICARAHARARAFGDLGFGASRSD